MSYIRIKNFGPIREGVSANDGWLDITGITVFVGNQGSGKSTVAKLISTFVWMEKVFVKCGFNKRLFEKSNYLKKRLKYHRLENYPGTDAVIEYRGDACSINFANGAMSITQTSGDSYSLPQITYIPAERNFLAHVNGARELKLSSEALQDFNTEYNRAKSALKQPVTLPTDDTRLEYNRHNDKLYLKGNDYRIEIGEASSGFQSFVPMYLVSNHLAHSISSNEENDTTMSSDEEIRFGEMTEQILSDDNLSDKQKMIAISKIGKQFNKTTFINIVEEPEQNLFPDSQWKALQSLQGLNNSNHGNRLIMTTHSPYMINYLTLLVKAGHLTTVVKTDDLRRQLEEIVSLNSTIKADELSIYEFDETTGAIHPLETYDGLPSDEHKLNEKLDESNALFARLLEIQQQS